jgi:uncharacterized repeat protein (TIGR04076 family)
MMKFKIEIEIFEGSGGKLRREGDDIVTPDFAQEGICPWMYFGDGEKSYQQGQRFSFPEEVGILCPELQDSMHGMLRTLQYGGTLFWTYEGTPYEKEIDLEGVTTEYIRCPDPTAAGIVVKLIRTRLPD